MNIGIWHRYINYQWCIFNSYVKLPEGTFSWNHRSSGAQGDMLSSTCEVTAARAHGVHVTCSLQSLVLSLWYSNMAITKSIKILYKLCLFYVFYGKIWEHHL